MNWIILFLAGLFETAWAVGLKYSEGFTRFLPSVFTAVAMILSVVLLGIAMRTIQLGAAYAVWTGIGTAGAVAAGALLFGDSVSVLRIASVGLIVMGIIGVKLSAS